MKNSTKNPVISKDDAKLIDQTFASVQPVMPINLLNRKDLMDRMAELEATDKNVADKAKLRLPMSQRLKDLDRVDSEEGWFDFGAPTTNLQFTTLDNDRGIQMHMKNHRGQIVKCNIDKLAPWNKSLPNHIETALQIAKATNQIAKFHTASFGKWSSEEWFATAYVTLVPRQETDK